MINLRTLNIIPVVAVALILAFFSGCSGQTGVEETEEVTVLLDWTPNTNFSGIYAATEEGFYLDENLTVEVIQAPGSVIQMTASGQAQFGFSFQEEVTFARSEGIPVVSLAAVLQENSSGFASLKERGIESAADFPGHTYGGWGSPVEEATIRALLDRRGLDPSSVDIVTTGEVDSLIVIEREADFAWIFYGWTGIEAELKGMEINFIALRDEDPALDYYTPVIVSGEELISDNPDLIERFMRATAAGYNFAADNPAEAAAHLLTNAPELDPGLVQASQEWLSPRYRGNASSWGIQKLKTWENYALWLHEHGLIDTVPEAENSFSNDFLP